MLGLLSGDVLLTRWLVGEAATGAYQVALQLGNMPFVLAVALFNAWGPLVLSHPLDRRWRWTARTGTALTAVVGLGAAGVALLGPWLVDPHGRPRLRPRRHGRGARGDLHGGGVLHGLSGLVARRARRGAHGPPRVGRPRGARPSSWRSPCGSPRSTGSSASRSPRRWATPCSWALTTWFARGHSPLRWPARLWLVVALAVVVALVGAVAPVEGGAAWLRLVAAAAVAGGRAGCWRPGSCARCAARMRRPPTRTDRSAGETLSW